MNFYSQKKLIKTLKEKGKNPLLFLPCLILRLIVTAFTAVFCAVDMALSDKKGNFLGIKRTPRSRKRSFDKELEELARRAESSPDNVPEKREGRSAAVIRRPLWKRAAAGILAFAFAFMIVPEIDISALSYSSGATYVQAAVPEITKSGYTGSVEMSLLNELDLCKAYSSGVTNPNGYDVNISSGTFNNLPWLTTITLYYGSDQTKISGNFSGISPDAQIFVVSSNANAVSDVKSQLGTNAANIKVIDDPSGTIKANIPDYIPAMSVTASSGIDCVVLEWDDVRAADGYAVYRINEAPDGTVRSIEKLGDFSKAEYSFPNNGAFCTLNVKGTAEKCHYSVRPYVHNNGIEGSPNLYSTKHYISPEKACSRQIASPPIVHNTKKDFTVTLHISNLDPNADYAKIFYKDEGRSISNFQFVSTFDITGTTYTFTDSNPLTVYGRDYTVVQYYDATGSHKNDNDRPLSNLNSPEYSSIESKFTHVVMDASIADPTDLQAVISNNELHLTWKAPNSSLIPNSSSAPNRYKLLYRVYVNGELYKDNIPNAYYNIMDLTSSGFLNGESVTVSVQAYCVDTVTNTEIAASNRVNTALNVSAPVITSIEAGNESFTVSWQRFSSQTQYYTVYWRTAGSSSAFNYFTTSALSYTKTGLINGTTYEVKVAANDSVIASQTVTVTPNNAPPAPTNLRFVACDDQTLTIKWDPVPEPGITYRIVVKNGAGNPIYTFSPHYDNILKLNGFINSKEYYFDVYALRDGGTGNEIASLKPAQLMGWSAPIVDEVANLTVTPQDNSLIISWLPDATATKYYLNRTDPQGNIEVIDVGTAVSYADTTVVNEVEYTYTVTTERIVGGIPYQKVSKPKKGKITLFIGTVENLTAKSGDGIVSLTWDKTANADGYYVECSIDGGISWTQIAKKLNVNSFVHTGLSNGTIIRYRVRAYRLVNNSEIFSPYAPMTVTASVGSNLPAPADFTVTSADGQVSLKWKAVSGAAGYNIYIVDSNGAEHLLDKSSKTSVVHNNLPNGTTLTYMVAAYKLTATGAEEEGDRSIQKTVTVGTYLNAPTDVTATAGNSQVVVKWKKVDGAEGYVVFCYDYSIQSFTPAGVVTSTSYTHANLQNGTAYTYMIAAYKTVLGEIKYSSYSISVTAVPTGKNTGSGSNNSNNNNSGSNNNNNNSNNSNNNNNNNNSNNNNNNNNTNNGGSINNIVTPSDNYSIYITGTTPYGMSNSNLISASSEKGAVNQDIDVRFTLDANTVSRIQTVLDYYGEGLESFMIYPMDISLYARGTDKKVQLNPGYYLTLTIPVPDQLLPYSSYISVIHISDAERLEILPSVHVNVGGVDCIQFTAQSFSPFAFVVYNNDTGENIASGSFAETSSTMSVEVSSSPAFMCTSLPEIYRRRARNKVYRIKK